MSHAFAIEAHVSAAEQLRADELRARRVGERWHVRDSGIAVPAMFVKYDTFHMQPSAWPYTGAQSGSAPASPPNVTSLGTTTGTEAGGTAVQVNGSGFTGATAVEFISPAPVGTRAATSVVVVNDNTITCVAPAGSLNIAGSGVVLTVADVKVTTPGGTSTLAAAYTYTSELARIFGATLSKEHRAAAQNIGLAAGKVSSSPDMQANGNATHGTAGKQPLYEATGLHGGPSMLFDGVDDELIATLGTLIASGSRPFMLAVFQRTGASGVFAFGPSAQIGLAFRAINVFAGYLNGIVEVAGPALDTGVTHTLCYGASASATGKLIFDGVSYNGGVTNAISSDLTTVSLSSNNTFQYAGLRLAHYALLSAEPTAPQITAALAFFASTVFDGPGYTGGTYA